MNPTSKNQVLEILKTIEFHDLHVGGIGIYTSKPSQDVSEFIVDIGLNDEDLEEVENSNTPENPVDPYHYKRLRFQEISKLETNALVLNADSDFEMTSFEYSWEEDFKGKMVFLLGPGQSPLAVEFVCGKIEIENLSAE